MIFASNSDSQHSTAEFRIKHPITYFIALRHREKVYYVPNRVFFELEKPTTFPGKVLVCGEYLYLNVSAYVTNLFLIQSGIIYAREDGVHLGGNLTPLKDSGIRQMGNGSFYLDSALHGKFTINLNSYNPVAGKGGVTFYLTADNSDWTGNLKTAWTKSASATECPVTEEHHVCVAVADAKSLGGNPEEFTYNSVKLEDYAAIRSRPRHDCGWRG